MCNHLLRLGVDFVYVSNKLGGSQNNISTLLNDKIQSVKDIIATHDMDCVDHIYRVICHYYLPTCGNFTHSILPSSLCQEECIYVQDNCQDTWQVVKLAFIDPQFIDCDDTSHLIFPLPNCCTGLGIELLPPSSTPSPESHTASVKSGEVAGIVIGILVFLILAVVAGFAIVFIFKYAKRTKRIYLERMQLDIMAM